LPSPKVDEEWHIIWQGNLVDAAEAVLGSGPSGFLEIFFVNHSATPLTAYDTNNSASFETWADAHIAATGSHAYANADNFNLELRHSVAFDVVVRVRFNRTHAWDGAKFIGADTRVNVTVSGGGVTISGLVSGTNVVSYNNTGEQYIWINVYWNGAGAGYTLLKGQTCVISQISIQARY
jgi:hypothetical protein